MSSALALYACPGGTIMLPAADLVLVGRDDGGNLIVNPPREVWERSRLTVAELTTWTHLVAATGEAMLAALPQLASGCLNYWEAGNWALNPEAHPPGAKTAADFRRVHLHLLGRSRTAANPDWAWGEAPRFPAFADRHAWAAANRRLTASECMAIVTAARHLLAEKYDMACPDVRQCATCRYPSIANHGCDDGRPRRP